MPTAVSDWIGTLIATGMFGALVVWVTYMNRAAWRVSWRVAAVLTVVVLVLEALVLAAGAARR